MKNLRFVYIILIALFTFSSCSNDDEPEDSSDLQMAVGVYELIELNISPAQDINNDGSSTSNVVSELPCATGTLNLRNDGNWIWTFLEINVSSITGGDFSITCTNSTTKRSGSWSISNNQVNLFDGANNYTFTKNEDQLSLSTGEVLPGFISAVYER